MARAKEPPPQEILRDMLCKGARMSVEGSSKAGKTWVLLNLGIAAAQGTSWLGFDVVKPCRVLYMDFELMNWYAAHRIDTISAKLGSGWLENFQYWPLRGSCYEFTRLKEHLLVSGQRNAFDLVVVDPYYKAAAGLDENSVGDVMKVLREIERFSEETDTAIVYAHHYSKGNKSEVDAIDRGSGSGAFGRDPDTKVMMTQHMEKDCLTVEPMCRNSRTPDKRVVETTFPTFLPRADLDPDDLYNPAKLEAYERKRDGKQPF
jgi:RecA-family ATPase